MQPFESKLRDQSFKSPPPALRDQLLAAAAKQVIDSTLPQTSTLTSGMKSSAALRFEIQEPFLKQLAELLIWRQPYAWGTLGLAWIAGLTLHFQSLPDNSDTRWAGSAGTVSTEALRWSRAEQAKLWAEFLAPPAASQPPAPPRSKPGAGRRSGIRWLGVVC